MRFYQYGRFEYLVINNGNPTFSPPPRLLRVIRVGSVDQYSTSELSDWTLRGPLVDMFQDFVRLDNGIVERLEFRRGLPCLIEIAVPATDEPTRSPQSTNIHVSSVHNGEGGNG